MYKIVRGVMFLLNAEKAHYVAMNGLKIICKFPFAKRIITNLYKQKNAEGITLLGLQFTNKIGLGAGFDKNAKYLTELETLGFGHIEIGTVTPKAQAGNAKPRLFRLPADKGLINRMGFNNDGATIIAERLKIWRQKHLRSTLIIGGNIGKNKDTPNELAWQDYVLSYNALHPYVHYFVINVSSPNTPGLRALQDKDSLRQILTQLQQQPQQLAQKKPLLLKIAPDLLPTQVDDVIDLYHEISLDGLVVSNTTLNRASLSAEGEKLSATAGAGGLSGKPVAKLATNLINYINTKSKGSVIIIGSGGIATETDAKEKYNAGASLLQVWTGFVYEGPGIVKKLARI